MREHDELKRKLRGLKKLELKLRFGHVRAVGGSPPRLVWDAYFDLRDGLPRRARYSFDELCAMDRDALKSVIESYMADVYFRAYGIGMSAREGDSGALSEFGLPFDADYELIKRRYRELIKKHHPDVGGDAQQFIKIKKSFDSLLKPK